jgi:TPR repeat protein
MIRNASQFLRAALVLIPSVMPLAVLIHSQTAFAAEEDVRKLEAKAEQGFVKEEVQLAAAYSNGEGVPQDPKLAAHWYQKAAESGNPEAQNQMGYFYEVGLGVPADPARALHWYQLSAASGLPDATLNLGVLYVLGLGVEKNVPVAAQYFQEAVRKGNGTGATYMGTLNYFGIGMQPDKAAAEHWYGIGQKLHDPMSAFNLGTLYSIVPDHPHDLYKAAGYLRQSAEAGYVPGMHSLAVFLLHHPESARSPDEAVHLLEFAANVGHWRSSLVLGVLARDGNGAPADRKAAYYHFQVAILQGGPKVQDLLHHDIEQLAAVLGSEQLEKLDSDANLWFHQHRLTLTFVNKKGYKGGLLPAPTHSDPAAVLHAGLPQSDPAS